MAQVSKRKLSGSTDGRNIKVVATASVGTTIHTAVSGTVAGTWDEVWLWAYNSSGSSIALTVQWGNTATPDDDIKITLAPTSGLVPIVPGLPLQNGAVVRAYAGSANVVTIAGYANAVTA